jgi:hypothetical protein
MSKVIFNESEESVLKQWEQVWCSVRDKKMEKLNF